MSLYAIHKSSGKSIPSYMLESDPYWMTKVNDEWLLPEVEIENLLEIKRLNIEPLCSFVKSHLRADESVQCHFRSKDERVITLNESSESEEHILAKEAIYYKILQGQIDFNLGGNIINSNKLPKFRLFIEKNINPKRADVLIVFDEENSILGKGIVIEIQLSLQNDEKTTIRSYDRALQGYSCVWLFDKHFSSSGELVNTELKVNPYRKLIEEYYNLVETKEAERIGKYHLALLEREENYLQLQNKLEILTNKVNDKIKEIIPSMKEEVVKSIEPSKQLMKEELYSSLNLYNQEIKKKAEENKTSALELITKQEENIKQEYNSAIERIKVISFNNLNESVSKLNNKIETILSNKVNEGIDLLKPTISKEIEKRLSTEEYQNNITEETKRKTEEYLSLEHSKKIAEMVENSIKEYITNREKDFDKFMTSAIISKLDILLKERTDEINRIYFEKGRQVEKDILSWTPELKKMAFEFIKNRAKEVTNEKGSDENKDKVSM